MLTPQESVKERFLNLSSKKDVLKAYVSIVVKELVGKVKRFEGLGLFEWDGNKWRMYSRKFPRRFTQKEARLFIERFVEPVINEVVELLESQGLFSDVVREATNWMLNTRHGLMTLWLSVRFECLEPGYRENSLIDDPYRLWDDRLTLSVSNGVVDLRTGQLYPHSEMKDRVLFCSLPISYDSAAKAPHFYEALDIYSNGDKNWIDYLQWMLGAAIAGYKRASNNIYVFYGSYKTKKDLLLTIIADVLGECTIKLPYFMLTKHNGHNVIRFYEVLHNRLMLYYPDFPIDRAPLNVIALKRLTEDIGWFFAKGRDVINRDIYSLFTPGNLYLSFSSAPRVADYETYLDSFLFRAWPIYFRENRRLAELDDIRFIKAILKEKEGILAWLVEGAKKNLKHSILYNSDLWFVDMAFNMKKEWEEMVRKANTQATQRNRKQKR